MHSIHNKQITYTIYSYVELHKLRNRDIFSARIINPQLRSMEVLTYSKLLEVIHTCAVAFSWEEFTRTPESRHPWYQPSHFVKILVVTNAGRMPNSTQFIKDRECYAEQRRAAAEAWELLEYTNYRRHRYTRAWQEPDTFRKYIPSRHYYTPWTRRIGEQHGRKYGTKYRVGLLHELRLDHSEEHKKYVRTKRHTAADYTNWNSKRFKGQVQGWKVGTKYKKQYMKNVNKNPGKEVVWL